MSFRLTCYLFGHKYQSIRRINSSIEEVFCERCFKEFGINHKIKSILPLDEELKQAHKIILRR